MNLSINDKMIVTRMAPDGRCRAYLRQAAPGGFSEVLPSANKGDDFAPAASPDGAWLAFYSSRSGCVNLWLSDGAGMNQRALTHSDVAIADFNPLDEPPIQFSPDSKKVAYLSDGNLWICDTSGLNAQGLTKEQGVAAFAWAPDGKHIAYLRFGSIYTIAPSGRPDELLAADATNWPTLAYNPDPKKHELYCFYNGVWKIDTLSRKRERLYGSFCFPNRLRSHPKGENIAFLSYSTDVREEIFQVNPAKKEGNRYPASQLTLGGALSPFYSLDGKNMYFLRKGALWRIGVQGEKATIVYNAGVSMPQAGVLEYLAAEGCP